MPLNRAVGCFIASTWGLQQHLGSVAACYCRQDPYIDGTVFVGATGRKVAIWVSSYSWKRKAIGRCKPWDQALEWSLGL